MSVTVTLNTKGLDNLLTHWDDTVEAIVVKVSNDVLAGSQKRAPKKTGYMANSGHVEPGEDRFSRYVVYSASYSQFVHDGTRYMVGRPFLRQEIEHERGSFQDAFSVLGKLATV